MCIQQLFAIVCHIYAIVKHGRCKRIGLIIELYLRARAVAEHISEHFYEIFVVSSRNAIDKSQHSRGVCADVVIFGSTLVLYTADLNIRSSCYYIAHLLSHKILVYHHVVFFSGNRILLGSDDIDRRFAAVCALYLQTYIFHGYAGSIADINGIQNIYLIAEFEIAGENFRRRRRFSVCTQRKAEGK